jgi:hypothetical protein
MDNYSLEEDVDIKIRISSRWGWFYFMLNSWLNLFSWIITVAMPFGFGVMLYIPEKDRQTWNILFLFASAFGLLLQIVVVVFRINKLAEHNIVKSGELEKAYHEYKNFPDKKPELVNAVKRFIEKNGSELNV